MNQIIFKKRCETCMLIWYALYISNLKNNMHLKIIYYKFWYSRVENNMCSNPKHGTSLFLFKKNIFSLQLAGEPWKKQKTN